MREKSVFSADRFSGRMAYCSAGISASPAMWKISPGTGRWSGWRTRPAILARQEGICVLSLSQGLGAPAVDISAQVVHSGFGLSA